VLGPVELLVGRSSDMDYPDASVAGTSQAGWGGPPVTDEARWGG
jgi:hypothetical protein